MSNYRKLNMEKLQHRLATEVVPTEKALKEITPFELPEEVLTGKRKIIIAEGNIDFPR